MYVVVEETLSPTLKTLAVTIRVGLPVCGTLDPGDLEV